MRRLTLLDSMQRTRHRTEPHPSVVYRDKAWDKTTIPWVPTDTTINIANNLTLNGIARRDETITDEVGEPDDGSLEYWLDKSQPQKSRRRVHFKECEHSYTSNEFDTTLRPKRFGNVCASSSAVMRVTPSHLATARALMPVPDYDMNVLAQQAMAFMQPALNEGVSALNFIAELHELEKNDPRKSFKRVLKGSTTLKSLRDPRIRSGFIKDTTRRLASAHLNAEFGIIPFVRDVVQIHDTLLTLSQRLVVLKQHAEKPLTRHYKRVLPSEPGKFWARGQAKEQEYFDALPSLETPFYDILLGGYPDRDVNPIPSILLRKTWVQRPTYHATLRYRYTLPEFGTETDEKISAYLEALGVRWDPTIPWNALRFSFLVDWVVDVSGFLSNFSKDTYEIKTEVLEFCHSIGWHSECSATVRERFLTDIKGDLAKMPLPHDSTPSDTLLPVWQGTDRYYLRERASPDANASQSKRITLRKAALAGSLIIANLSSLRNRRGQYLRHAATESGNSVHLLDPRLRRRRGRGAL